MSVIATAELCVEAPLERAFQQFIDFSQWARFMPPGFRPIAGPARALRKGDRFTMAVGPGPGLRSPLVVVRLRENKEICWRGGVPGVLVGEHSFFFDAEGEARTRVRSEEPFTGVVARLLGKLLEREAGKVGERTLTSFAAFVAR